MTSKNVIGYNLETTPNGFRMNTSMPGCMRVIGSIFMLPGLYIIAGLLGIIEVKFAPDFTRGDWVGMFLFGLAFAGFGLGLGFYRSYTVIDLRARKLMHLRGIWRLKEKDSAPLDNVTEMIISRTVLQDSDGDNIVVFEISFLSKDGHNVIISNYNYMADAMKVAIAIAGRMGLKVYDTTINGRPEITAQDVAKDINTEMPESLSRYEFKNLAFQWDGHKESLSKLSTASQSGISFYKVEYPEFIIHRLIPTVAGVGFFIYVFGWRLDQTIPKILGGFWDPQFLHSAEVFFSTLIGSAFVAFLIGPVLFFILSLFKPAPFSIIGVGADGLYMHDPQAKRIGRQHYRKAQRHKLFRYADISGMDLHAKEKRWKTEKRDNVIRLRVGTELYEIGSGLDRAQLQIIADDIKPHMLRNPAR